MACRGDDDGFIDVVILSTSSLCSSSETGNCQSDDFGNFAEIESTVELRSKQGTGERVEFCFHL